MPSEYAVESRWPWLRSILVSPSHPEHLITVLGRIAVVVYFPWECDESCLPVRCVRLSLMNGVTAMECLFSAYVLLLFDRLGVQVVRMTFSNSYFDKILGCVFTVSKHCFLFWATIVSFPSSRIDRENDCWCVFCHIGTSMSFPAHIFSRVTLWNRFLTNWDGSGVGLQHVILIPISARRSGPSRVIIAGG